MKENDKLICLFMGYSYYEELKFNKSWDSLMHVVSKIKSKEIFEMTNNIGVSYPYEFDLDEALIKCNIEEVYKSCVNYIKWYNLTILNNEKWK